MKWTAISLALMSVACAGRSWEEIPVVADLNVPQPCRPNDLAGIWTDSLPIIADSARHHIVAGDPALQYPADLALESRTGLVRARFVIDTAGRVMPESGIIEASSDQQFARAVCYALPNMRFEPVVLDGHKAVVGLVHVPFTFGVK
jgi:TonB-like protein